MLNGSFAIYMDLPKNTNKNTNIKNQLLFNLYFVWSLIGKGNLVQEKKTGLKERKERIQKSRVFFI